MDFASLRQLEQQLIDQFDHTVLVNSDDPLMDQWQALHDQGALDLRVMDNVGMEASAALIWDWANALLLRQEGGRACCWRVEARENEKNAACYTATPSWYPSSSQSPRQEPWPAPKNPVKMVTGRGRFTGSTGATKASGAEVLVPGLMRVIGGWKWEAAGSKASRQRS